MTVPPFLAIDLAQTSRFSIIYDIVRHHSLVPSLESARLSYPDIGFVNGHYVPMVNPGASFFFLPSYALGVALHNPLIVSGIFSIIIATCNGLLIRHLLKGWGTSSTAASLAAIVFLFATPAFAFSSGYFPHHVTVLVLLLSLTTFQRRKDAYVSIFFPLLYGVSILIDYSNAVIFLPMALYFIWNYYVGPIVSNKKYLTHALYSVMAFSAPMGILYEYNKIVYGSPFVLSGIVPEVLSPASMKSSIQVPIVNHAEKGLQFLFHIHTLFKNLYIEFFRIDRGTIVFTPILLVGIFGLWYWYYTDKRSAFIITSTVLVVVFFYALFFDPAAGWSFGDRYLIPAYALLALGIGNALERWREKKIVLVGVGALMLYSTAINLLGVLTNNLNPPLEIFHSSTQNSPHIIDRIVLLGYGRNITLIQHNTLTSYFYNSFFSTSISGSLYYWFVLVIICCGIVKIIRDSMKAQ